MSDSLGGFLVHHKLPELAQTHIHQVSDAIQPSHPLLSPSPPVFTLPASGSFSMSQFFTSDGQNIGSFSFSISPSNECSRLIYFRIDWLDLLAVQGTLKSLLQHHSSKALILQCSAFFMVQLSHTYTATGKSHSICYTAMNSTALNSSSPVFSLWSSPSESCAAPVWH